MHLQDQTNLTMIYLFISQIKTFSTLTTLAYISIGVATGGTEDAPVLAGIDCGICAKPFTNLGWGVSIMIDENT